MPRKTKQNNITSPEILAQINYDNTHLKEDFLHYLQSIQRSPKTIFGYNNDLDIFFSWNLQHNDNKPFQKITKRNFADYQSWLINTNGNSPARVRRLKAAISSMSNFCENILDDEEEFKNFRASIKKIENPVNQPVREKTVLSEEQVDSLLKHLSESGQHQKACLVALAVCSGRRKSELVLFKCEYFEDSNLICDGALYKTSEKIKTKGRGVYGKQIYCYTLAKKFKPYFDAWMKQREELNIQSEWLFPMLKDFSQHIKAETLTSWSNTFGKILGVHFYMHALRHSWTTMLIRAGLPETIIKELAQWESMDMVSIYNDCEAEEQFENYFKNGDIDCSNRVSGLNDKNFMA